MRLQYHSNLQITDMQNVSRGGFDGDSVRLLYDAVLIGKQFLTIRTSLLPPSLQFVELTV